MKKKQSIKCSYHTDNRKKLKEIIVTKGIGMSEVIMQAIEFYYHRSSTKVSNNPFELAKHCRIIGRVKGGSSDMSSRYQEFFFEGLSQKYSWSKSTKQNSLVVFNHSKENKPFVNLLLDGAVCST